jgi:hypothetical protein
MNEKKQQQESSFKIIKNDIKKDNKREGELTVFEGALDEASNSRAHEVVF